jgi:hypothetical protein
MSSCGSDCYLQAQSMCRRNLGGFTLNSRATLPETSQPSSGRTSLADRTEALIAVDNTKLSPTTKELIRKCDEGLMTFDQARRAILARAGIVKRSGSDSLLAPIPK